MSYSLKDLSILVQATLRIYFEALLDSLRAMLANWWVVFLHAAFFLLVGFVQGIAFMLFGGLAGGFVVGMLLTVIMAAYFSTVEISVNKQKVVLSELWTETKTLFFPLLSVLFALFLLNIVISFLLKGADTLWIKASLNLLIAVLFNTLPEVVYTHRSMMGDSFSLSFEFIRENFIEWFMPVLVLILPLAIYSPETFKVLSLFFITTNPLHIIETLMVGIGGLVAIASFGGMFIVFVFLMYFVFIFRGFLYQRLASSSRRKRIYQAKSL